MLIAAAAEVQSSAYGDFGDYHEFVSEAVRKISAVAMTDKRRTREGLGQTAEKLLARMEKVQLGQIVSRVPTGISKLDRLMRGGMARGHLVVPCGLTSMGKSSWAFQVAFRGAEQRHVHALIFSLEMSREEALVKGAASLSKVGTEMFQNLPGEKVDWDNVNAIMARAVAQEARIRIEEHRSIGEIVAVSHAWHADLPPLPDGSPPPAVILVDHLQKVIGVRSKNSNRQEEVWGVAQDLKNLAKDLEVPVVAPGQLDNDAAKEKRAPRIGDMRDSKAIEHEADVVLGIHRNRLEAEGRCEMILLKHRGGRVGKRTVTWRGEWQGFEDPASDDVPPDEMEPEDFR
ncbi:MAG: DnaB-like helicase C-terminal domain-containing protein [Pseudomonadota bacterium]